MCYLLEVWTSCHCQNGYALGVLASASNIEAVNRLYAVRGRNPNKSCILLVSSADDIPGLSDEQRKIYSSMNFRAPTTVISQVSENYLPHLVRTNRTLAFRVIYRGLLLEIISQTGPLLAPSANPEGKTPARNVREAKRYFGNGVSLYLDNGTIDDVEPSRIIIFNDDESVSYLRGNSRSNEQTVEPE